MGMYDDYEPVADRLAKWWTDQPGGRIETRYDFTGDAWVFRATLYREGEELPAASGYARQELLCDPPEGRGGKPNKFAPEYTNPVEVGETSAIGRALANLGYQAKAGAAGRPSREEMSTESRNPPDLTNETKQAVMEIAGGDAGKAAQLWAASVDDPDVTISTKVTQSAVVAEANRIWKDSQTATEDPEGRPF